MNNDRHRNVAGGAPGAGSSSPPARLRDQARILLLSPGVNDRASRWWPVLVGLSGLLALLVSIPR